MTDAGIGQSAETYNAPISACEKGQQWVLAFTFSEE
jgi:hypothetical protein